MNLGALVLVTTSYTISGDGREAAGSFVADLADEASRRMPVRVVAPGHEDAIESPRPGLQIYRYAASDKPLSTLRPWRARDLTDLFSVMAQGQKATDRAVSDGSVARILALWALPCGHWARRAARRGGLSYSVWTLGSDIWSLGRIPVVRSHLARVLGDAETCYSDGLQLAEDTKRIGGREVEFLPSTRRIDGMRIAAPKNAHPYRLLFLGRWHPNKGVDLLLQALAFLGDDAWSCIDAVEICGGGPMEVEVRREVERLRALGRPVELHGYLDKAAAEEAMLRADFVMIPSRIESIPVVFSDAMKLGCPVITMPVGDLSSLIHQHGCGICAETVSAPAFAAALRTALRSSPADFSHGVEIAARDFDLHRIVDAILPPGLAETGEGT
ncbi:MAG TPA: glycosyltransferase [Chiayiivirga sp.]|nr:glycosyltransferase [Chiayiivirga sp.]